MKKPIIFSVLFLIISSISSSGQVSWIIENIDPDTGFRTGTILVRGKDIAEDTNYGIYPDRNLNDSVIKYADLTNVNLYSSNIRGADWRGTDLTGASLKFTLCENTNFSGADFTRADLTRSVLRNANFTNANFTCGCWINTTCKKQH